MKVQGADHLLGQPVSDVQGRRIGRIVALTFGRDPFAPAWLILVLSLVRRRLRAVPASDLTWSERQGLTVPLARSAVLDSPQLHRATLDPSLKDALERHYRMRRP